MVKWEIFEKQSTDFLNKFFNANNIRFQNSGGSDSTNNDILVFKDNKHISSIEAKLSPAQCGQFVLINKGNDEYILSDNMVYQNRYTHEILKNIDFKDLEKNSIYVLEINQSLLSKWVAHHYETKGVDFIITSNSLDSFHAIIPISDMSSFFSFSCVLRKKRSGTRNIPKKGRDGIINLLNNHLKELKLSNYNIVNEESGVYLTTAKNTSIEKTNLYFNQFFLSIESENNYKIKKRASTNNPNVIFSLKYIGPKEDYGLNILEKYLETK